MKYTEGDPLPLLIRFPYSDVTAARQDRVITRLEKMGLSD
jgi:hypothetical protein